MPAPLGVEAPRLGQGYRGGAGAVDLTEGRPAGGLPLPPTGIPHIKPTAPPPVPLMSPLTGHVAPALDVPRPVASNVPVQSSEGVGAAILSRGLPTLWSADAAEQAHKPLMPIERKAMKAIQDPIKNYDPKDTTTTALVRDPSPRMQLRLADDPELARNHALLAQHIQTNPGTRPNVLSLPAAQPARNAGDITPPLPVRGTHDAAVQGGLAQGNQQVQAAAAPTQAAYQAQTGGSSFDPLTPMSPQDQAELQAATAKEASAIPFSPAAVIPKLGTEVAQTAIGIGPGLYKMGGDIIHGRTGHLEAMGAAMGRSMEETATHPLRQLSKDPLGFITNVATPLFVGAGAAARGAEIGRTAAEFRAGEVLPEGMTRDAAGMLRQGGKFGKESDVQPAMTKGQLVKSVARTLLRPKPVERSIKGPAGEIQPPAFKSALGGYLQRDVFDPITEKRLNSVNVGKIQGAVNVLAKPIGADKAGGLFTSEARYGRMVRQETQRTARGITGVAQGKGLGEDVADAKAQAAAHMQLWHEAFNAAPPYEESYAVNPDRYVAIKQPPQKLSEGSVKAYGSDRGVANAYRKMVENNPEKIAANPDAYRFIPRTTWNSMQPYEPATGAAAGVLNTINNASQLIRLGRFLHPGYAAWAVQNGILHMSQAGMFAIRNAWQLRNEYPRLGATAKAFFDHQAGTGVAQATTGEAAGKFANASKLYTAGKKLGAFWHKVDDSYWRKLSLIHELNSAGYHDAEAWTNLMRTNPKRFQTIANRAEDEAIKYNDATPAERQTLQKLFTAYGWTRGATRYTARFAWQHPIQARIGLEAGAEGKNTVEKFYSGLNGMVPEWLRGYYPLEAGNSPWMLGGGVVNPAETTGTLMGEIPGITTGSNSSLLGEEAPAGQALQELATGTNRYGSALKGSARVTQPFADMFSRFEPYSALKNALGGRTSGTFVHGGMQGLAAFLGTGMVQLANAKKSASLGMKDYEQSLAAPDEIKFRIQNTLTRLPQEAALYQKATGTPVDPNLFGRLLGDLEMVQQRDLYQYHYASAHGAKSWKSLPALNKLQGTIAFIQQHRLVPEQTLTEMVQASGNLKTDKQVETFVHALWAGTGIGAVSTSWKNMVKGLTPQTLTPPNK